MNPPADTLRVALLVPSLGGGGAERNMVRLANGLARRGHEVALVAVTGEGPNRVEVGRSVRLVDLQCPRVSRALPKLVRYLVGARPDVLVASHEHGNVAAIVAAALARTGTPLIVTLRSTLSAQARHAGNWRDRWLLPVLARRLYPRAARIVALSVGAAADAETWLGLPRGIIRVIPNPVVSAALLEKAAIPVDHGAGESPLILAAGRLAPEKGFATLLEAFALLLATGVDARLRILGDGPERPALEAEAARLGLGQSVTFPGYSDNPYAWMARADVFVLSSRFEGLPTALIEALACGAPVVSTDCPSGPREILENGRLGTLVPVGDAAAMAQAIGAALTAPRGSRASASLARYTEEGVLDAYEALMCELLADRR